MKRGRVALQVGGRPATSSDQPTAVRRRANAASTALLAVEIIGSLLMWAPMPLAWFWVGARVYDATGSIAADCGVTLLGFAATVIPSMMALTHIDSVWVTLRRRAGRDQAEGALTQVVVVSATLGLLLFLLWFYVFGRAFVIPFMPLR